MATGGVWYEEHFWCCICLDVFTDPVTIPCGHNFCKSCITQHWSSSGSYQCALCKEQLNTRPELRVNTVLSQMACELRNTAEKKVDGEGGGETGQVWCDVCGESKAVKSCLVCLTSFCERHLEPHYRSSRLSRHQLIEPVSDLEERTCKRHNRPLRYFCQTDQTCVCQFCSESEHSRHTVVSVEQESQEKKSDLGKHQAKLLEMALERRVKIDQLKQTARLDADKTAENVKDSVQAVFKVTRSLEKGLSRIIERLEQKQRAVERETDGFVAELEDEICVLMNTRAELEQSKNTDDDFTLLQNFDSLKTVPTTKDWSEVRVQTFQRSIVDRVVAQMEEMVENVEKLWMEVEFKNTQQYAVDVTLDPDTAHPALILSDDGKQVQRGNKEQKVSNNPKRFSTCVAVLAKQSVSSGRFYYEVQVGEKSSWELGVVSVFVDTKGVKGSPNNGYWLLSWRTLVDCRVVGVMTLKQFLNSRTQTVGVFVDYEEGVVSFYDTDTAEVIHSFNKCEFTGKLYPYFSPGESDGQPLIISPVTKAAAAESSPHASSTPQKPAAMNKVYIL